VKKSRPGPIAATEVRSRRSSHRHLSVEGSVVPVPLCERAVVRTSQEPKARCHLVGQRTQAGWGHHQDGAVARRSEPCPRRSWKLSYYSHGRCDRSSYPIGLEVLGLLIKGQSPWPHRRFMIALHSPHLLVETGLRFCCPEKNAPKLPYSVWRVAFSSPV
jgi:hypothetical protein